MIHLTEDNLADGLHVALGAIFVILPAAWGWEHAQIRGTEMGLIYGLVKEFWFDMRYEDLETSGGWSGGVRDFLGYVAGILLANALLWL